MHLLKEIKSMGRQRVVVKIGSVVEVIVVIRGVVAVIFRGRVERFKGTKVREVGQQRGDPLPGVVRFRKERVAVEIGRAS